MSEPTTQRSEWTSYPHDDLAFSIDEIHKHAAHMDAWRAFFSQDILAILHDAGCTCFNLPNHSYNLGRLEILFPDNTSEEAARKTIAELMFPTFREDQYEFIRTSLNCPNAEADIPLHSFVDHDRRINPTVRFLLPKHWKVLLGNFTIGSSQKDYKKYDTLIFSHHQIKWREGTQEVARLIRVKGQTTAERRECLLLELETKAEEWKFSILEREVVRRLNGESNGLTLS